MGFHSPRLSRRRFLELSAAAGAVSALPLPRALAAEGCHPTRTDPQFLGLVPTPDSVLGFTLGLDREVTTPESDAVIDAIAAASDRVVADTMGFSVKGRPIRYAIVGDPHHVTPQGLADLRDAHRRLGDPSTPRAQATALAETTPAILWIGGCIHGNEESGADAALSVLHGLADRDDCVVRRILRKAVVIIVPIQNPDGRERNIRRNNYGVDLNRDHLSRTQPETDAKVQLMRRYPPQLFLDHHEFGYYRSFFPPNDDPVYHEVTDEVLYWINDVYGPAMAREFRRRNWEFFNRGQGYDFFAPIFTDTLTSFGFQGVGMTIEVYNGATIVKRFKRQTSIMWVTLSAAAERKERFLRGWHASFVQAVEEGRRGRLLRNKVFESDNAVRVQPPREPVRHYFVRTDNQAKARETQTLVRQLQRMDVDVYELDAPVEVDDFRPHTERARRIRLPRGTYWIPMAQAQKRWIQAAMNEDAYQPIDRAYGLTGFSLALLSGADVGWSGRRMSPQAHLLDLLPPAGPPASSGAVPSIRVLQTSGGVFSWESTRWLEWLFTEDWNVPYAKIYSHDVRARGLEGADVLIVPSGGVNAALRLLGRSGQRKIVDFVNDGGRMIAYRFGGAELAWALGLSGARYGETGTGIRDVLLRVELDSESPLARGVGRYVWMTYDGDYMMHNDPPGIVARFPTRDGDDFEVNGFPGGTRVLPGRGVITDERIGAGRVITSALELNYRCETVGAQRILWNAIFGANPDRGAAREAVSFDPDEVDRRAATLEADELLSAIFVAVPFSDAAEAERILSAFGAPVRRVPSVDGVGFAVENRDELSEEEHPFAGSIPDALESSGVEVLAFRAPS